MSSDTPPRQETTARRGLLVITAAKIWFLLGASILNFALPYLLPSKVSYGEWGFVLSVVSPINNVMITATLQAVARFAARGPGAFDLLVANILAETLVELRPALAAAVRPGGTLVLSGIESRRLNMVEEAFIGRGWRLARTVPKGDWVSLSLHHDASAAEAASSSVGDKG